jgi:uncharacterized membrane protein YphA (DoxX/SURF4 family)
MASLFFSTSVAEAHEAYVLDHDFFWDQMSKPFSLHALDAMKDQGDVHTTIVITLSIMLVLLLNFLFRLSRFGKKTTQWFEKMHEYGPLVVRLAISVAFFFSAQSMSFLGPELPLSHMPLPYLLQILLYIASACIAVGFLTEVAAFIALSIFCIGFFEFGAYLVTYLNYLGEILALVLFGTRSWSVDKLLFGPLKRFEHFRKYETTIVRICYGVALSFAAITVKFLHPELTIEVVNHWNLTQFHWLFPSDPLLVAFGAGLSELAIGLFIVVGFEMRLIVLISLFYITLSLMFFRELVWPHLMLYGISLNLLVQPEVFTLDHLLFDQDDGIPFWKRPFLPHKKSF